ncbi:amidohydrolase family protein [Pantoea sp. A4]|uniref:amidohydrolase family protein n=1 Tax=Pantoea sp. A4 TaxID=1225184 RepID=UPI0008FAD9FD|nr:amidohydrolase family protein [Pantoea sp. A4]
MQIPFNACDCHMHIYDDRYQSVNNPALNTANASLAEYQQQFQPLGFRRHILVLPSTYQDNNQIILDALACHRHQARGVAVLDGRVSRSQLVQLSAQGITGLRYNLVRSAPGVLQHMAANAALLAEFGWHINLHLTPKHYAEAAPLLESLPCEVVLDHFGRVDFSGWQSSSYVAAIRKKLRSGQWWIKLSGLYLSLPASTADINAFAHCLLAEREDRLLWGSDWPHPTSRTPINERDNLASLFDWATTPQQLAQVLVNNPQQLYFR